MNKVVLIGRLARDPDIRDTSARYTLAVDRNVKKDGSPSADFISCIAFGKTSEFVEKYLHKGMKIAIEGRISTGSYEKDGVKHYTTDVVVDRHEFCESRSASSAPAADEGSGYDLNDLQNFPEVKFTESDEDDGNLPF